MQIKSLNIPFRTEGPFLVTIGVFDGVHAGHQYLLKQLTETANEQGLKAMVVTFSNHPRQIISPESHLSLLSTVPERLSLIEKTGVGYCLLTEFTKETREMSAGMFIDLLNERMNIGGIMAGYDHSFGRKEDTSLEETAGEKGLRFFRAMGLTIDEKNVSSSRIRSVIRTGDMESASRLLNRDYSISGTVIHGRELGRSIGFPTANIRPVDASQQIPMDGVYSCEATIEGFVGKTFHGVVNIGTNPTVSDNGKPSIEAHILGLEPSTDLYGKGITIGFKRFIRGERRFDSLEDLKKQIVLDINIASDN